METLKNNLRSYDPSVNDDQIKGRSNRRQTAGCSKVEIIDRLENDRSESADWSLKLNGETACG